jgi:RimJ/RimL family protein N-acetyltransferase
MDRANLMIEFNNPHHAEIVADACKAILNKEYDHCISRTKNGELLGGGIFTNYTGRSVCMHIASFDPSWLNRDLLWVAFHYPFVQLKCQKILAMVPANNHRALEFDTKLGFKEETIIRDVYNTGDMIVLSMYKDDCRWLKLKPKTIAETEYDDGWR